MSQIGTFVPPSSLSLLPTTTSTLPTSQPDFQLDPNLVVGHAQLREALGIPTEVLLKTGVSSLPPPLPDPHFSRAELFSDIARAFDLQRTVSVIGYPESGKSVAVAEYAKAYPGDVFWFTVPSSATHPSAWYGLLCYVLAQSVGSSSFSTQSIRTGLLNRDHPLLVVIDNAQNCDDFDSLSFLFEAAEATSHIAVLLVGTNEPSFVSSIRARGIGEWRIPGLTSEQARAFIEQKNGTLSSAQLTALKFLCSRVDGHLGMLKLSRRAIREIRTGQDCNFFVQQISSSLGIGLDSLQSAMIERLRNGLEEGEIELCRRLSLVIAAFPRNVGERLWTLDRSLSEFHAVWNSCVMRVFENHSIGRFALPDLYRDGLRREVEPALSNTCHGLIADVFEEREGNSISVFDVYSAVVHRLLSGNVTKALDSAAGYLIAARGPHAKAAQQFLIRRFELWLATSATDINIPVAHRVKWYAVCLRVYNDLDDEDNAASTAELLRALLSSAPGDTDQKSLEFGWMLLLMHASTRGKPDLAETAAYRIDSSPIAAFERDPTAWRELLVLSAYLTSQQSPLKYLRKFVTARVSSNSTSVPLWGKYHGYDFWRAVMVSVYSRENEATDLTIGLTADIATLAAELRAMDENDIALLFNCLLVQVQIDHHRTFQQACELAVCALDFLTDATDRRVAAYVHDNYGDALRCSGQDRKAIEAYSAALELWPDSERLDKAETLLMRGISLARCQLFRDATRSALKAAELQLQRSKKYQGLKLAPARSLLEAAAFAIHGEHYSLAGRCLIQAHDILNPANKQRSEWPALGQIAWSLANRIKHDPQNPQPPAPGFTMSLGEIMPEAENMDRGAPTLMLARACDAVGRPHRALTYFESALTACSGDETKTHVAILALDAALSIQDLALSTKYATLGSHWLKIATSTTPQGLHAFVFDYLIGRVVRLVSKYHSADISSGEVNRAICLLSKCDTSNPANQVLGVTFRAYQKALQDDNDSDFDSAFQFALNHSATSIAREIAWFWCFRYSLDHPSYENQYLLWHWRLCCYSLEIGRSDPPYLESVAEQERLFWNRIPAESQSGRFRDVLDLVNSVENVSSATVHGLTEALAINACRTLNVTDVSNEIANQARTCADTRHLAKPLDTLYVRLMDLALHPGAPHVLRTLRGDIASVLDSIRAKVDLSHSVRQFEDLDALTNVLETGEPSVSAFEALYRVCPKTAELSPNSAAQVYIWLRHFIQVSPDNIELKEISEILTGVAVSNLVNGDQLLPYIKLRLATSYLSSRAVIAHGNLSRALSMIALQRDLDVPVRASAAISAESLRDSALKEFDDIVSELTKLRQTAEAEGLKNELWSCLIELGGVRGLTGAALLLFAKDPSAIEKWLKPALNDYQRAVEVGSKLAPDVQAELALKAAFSGRIIAKAVNDQAAFNSFDQTISELRATGRYVAIIAAQEALELQSPLHAIESDHDRRDRNFESEEQIQFATDQIMQSTGWPQDRREFVEDDVRKMARIEREQVEFCQHLQPLQDLVHTQSPRTIYTAKTRYTCSCTLLGIETHIELDDIDAVISTMKNVHCNSCLRRSPREQV